MDNENATSAPQTPSTDEVKKESDKRSLVYIIVSLLIVLVAAGAYFMGTRKTQPQESPTPSPEIVSPIPSESPLGSPTATPKATKTPTSTPTPTPTATPTATPMADLYISEYSFDHEPKTGEPFTVRIGIYNKGDKAAGGFYWEWWATTSAPTYACRERIDSLAAHGGRIVTCTYTYSGWANYTTKAIADKDNEVLESVETNNTKEQQLVPIHE